MTRWKIYLKTEQGSPTRFLEVRESEDLSIYVHPYNTLYFPRELIQKARVGDQLEFRGESSIKVDHFSLHSKTGQRHIKKSRHSRATEPAFDRPLFSHSDPIPLFSMVVREGYGKKLEPVEGENWKGINIPADCNYAILDAILAPKGSDLQVQSGGLLINNTSHSSTESFGNFYIELTSHNLFFLIRTSNYELSNVPSNIFFRQEMGKTVSIVRVYDDYVLAQVEQRGMVKNDTGK